MFSHRSSCLAPRFNASFLFLLLLGFCSTDPATPNITPAIVNSVKSGNVMPEAAPVVVTSAGSTVSTVTTGNGTTTNEAVSWITTDPGDSSTEGSITLSFNTSTVASHTSTASDPPTSLLVTTEPASTLSVSTSTVAPESTLTETATIVIMGQITEPDLPHATDDEDENKPSKVGTIVGFTILAIVIVISVLSIGCYVLKRRKCKAPKDVENQPKKKRSKKNVTFADTATNDVKDEGTQSEKSILSEKTAKSQFSTLDKPKDAKDLGVDSTPKDSKEPEKDEDKTLEDESKLKVPKSDAEALALKSTNSIKSARTQMDRSFSAEPSKPEATKTEDSTKSKKTDRDAEKTEGKSERLKEKPQSSERSQEASDADKKNV
ncbi:hypothetical protein L596_022002 [Steinernema carpocapsae]|uniref:Ig-like domain-containing protein n=1 Tax=Steinernema carpocapsae TaxID=34508 RepID=A0A4U5MKI6_STECR|nr:hypothetical protein L596_022002 [Steinernema carpocapsae]